MRSGSRGILSTSPLSALRLVSFGSFNPPHQLNVLRHPPFCPDTPAKSHGGDLQEHFKLRCQAPVYPRSRRDPF